MKSKNKIKYFVYLHLIDKTKDRHYQQKFHLHQFL